MRDRRYILLLGVILGSLLFGAVVVQASPPLPPANAPADQEAKNPLGDSEIGGLWSTQVQPIAPEVETLIPMAVEPVPPARQEIVKVRPPLKARAEIGEVTTAAVSLPDLRPFVPGGWSYAVVPSSVQGTQTVNALYAGQPTYLDWAVINDSSASISTRFYIYLYIDGNRIASWFADGLSGYWYAFVRDYALTVATPGWHTVRLVADPTGAIAEADEANNAFEHSFYWQPVGKPNLKPFTPAGWSAPIVPASTQGTTVANNLFINQPTYIDWAITNDSSVPANTRIYTYLYLDGVRIASWYADSLLPHWSAFVHDWPYTVLAPGFHTFRLLTDATNAVDESDETDNTLELTFYWHGVALPNLKPYQPAGWSGPLVVSNAPGTNTATTVLAGKPIYIDWAVVNDSSVAINTRFFTYLYVDDARIASWYTDALPGHWFAFSTDLAHTVATAGWHRFRLVTDATGTIGELDEGDNSYELSVWFEPRVDRRVGVEWINSYVNSGLPSLEHNDENALGFYNELVRIGWTPVFRWGNSSAWEKDFKDPLKGGIDSEVVDNVSFAYFSGHGGKNGLRFDSMHDDHELRYTEAIWGNGMLNWLVADACEVLNNDDGQAITRWGQAFAGLHMLLSFGTNCHDVPNRGENLARYADGSYWWSGPLPIKDAWFQAAAVTEDATTYSAALIAIQGDINPAYDFLPGVGSFSADPVTPTNFVLWRVQN